MLPGPSGENCPKPWTVTAASLSGTVGRASWGELLEAVGGGPDAVVLREPDAAPERLRRQPLDARDAIGGRGWSRQERVEPRRMSRKATIPAAIKSRARA